MNCEFLDGPKEGQTMTTTGFRKEMKFRVGDGGVLTLIENRKESFKAGMGDDVVVYQCKYHKGQLALYGVV